MDAKNLAVLQEMRDSMKYMPATDPSETPKTVAWLKILAQSLSEPEPRKSPKPKKRKSGAGSPKASKPTHAKSATTAMSNKKKRKQDLDAQRLRSRLLSDKTLAAKYRDCRECGRPVHIGENIPLYPVRCERCRNRDGQIDLGIRASKGSQFSEITVVPGGAPGLGKRK
ncbi:hypothetical protein CXB42_05050 [Pseudomonas syringae pv. syringae]|uniref:Uncharacterized protein n=1 Tax=Pseudomonas syringae pv. syringae TaxID=321 RepID=A0AAE5S9L5_PSESY|nr:hypothetical protein CXB42_05050 [Pseudomonas syringae pv. syringae]